MVRGGEENNYNGCTFVVGVFVDLILLMGEASTSLGRLRKTNIGYVP